MANLRIQGYPGLGRGESDSDIQAVTGPTTEEQVVAIGAVARSVAFNTNTRIICVEAEAICAIRLDRPATGVVPVGANADASATTSKRMVAGQTEYFRVNAASGDYISVISTT